MARNAEDVSRQSPTPAQGPEGSDLRSIAGKIEGLLDDDGHFNPNPDELSRGHPDYDESADPRAATPERDERGRFKKAEPAAGEGDDTAESDETLDIPSASDDRDADDDQQQVAADADTDDDLATSADDEALTDDGETGDEITSMAEFAAALEMSTDDFKEAMSHTFNAAGEEVTVTLAELEKGYQKDADYRRSTAKLASDRQNAENEFQQRHLEYDRQNHILASSMQIAEQVVMAELQDPRLAELRERDPAEWTARREEIGQRIGALRQQRQQAAAAYEQFVNSNRAQLRAREEASLLEAIPDFGAKHKATARSVMSSFGYSDREIGEIFDHRLVQAALSFDATKQKLAAAEAELAELRALKKQGKDAVRRVKKDVPKLAKPGKGRRKPVVRRDRVQQLRKKAAKSGSVKDAAAVIEQMI